jgi:hypothetical protein
MDPSFYYVGGGLVIGGRDYFGVLKHVPQRSSGTWHK